MAFEDLDLQTLSPKDRRKVIGREISMIFQEPIASLNPCFTVGFQLGETLKTHTSLKGRQIKDRVIELMHAVGLPDPEGRYSAFPHQMSGGQCQRVMIAMAIACSPKLLIADEPTTALDVTIQKQILDLLVKLQQDSGMGLIMITHDMGVVAETEATSTTATASDRRARDMVAAGECGKRKQGRAGGGLWRSSQAHAEGTLVAVTNWRDNSKSSRHSTKSVLDSGNARP